MESMINLLKEIQCMNLEYMNGSFNKNQVNSPIKTFYSAKMVNLFKENTNNFEEMTQENIHIAYMSFLKDMLGIVSITLYFKELAKKWKNSEDRWSEKEMYYYILKVFILNSIKGEIKERVVYEKVASLGIPFRKANFIEDSDMCIDIFIGNPDNEVGLQVKPNSFFYSLKGNSENSLKKISKASKTYNKPIFLTKEENGEVFVLVRGEELKTKFISLQEFSGILDFSKEQIQKVSRDVFTRL